MTDAGTEPVLPLVEQVVEPDWWHAYGPLRDGGVYVHGPTTLSPDTARTLGRIIAAKYIGSFDHEPTAGELNAAGAP